MRTPVITRFITFALTVALSAALPLTAGATAAAAASACGSGTPTPSSPAADPAGPQLGSLRAGFGASPLDLTATEDEPLVLTAEFGTTGEAATVRPVLGLDAYGPEDSPHRPVDLRPEDVTVELETADGTRTPLPLRAGCAPTLRTDGTAPALPLPGGHSAHVTLRITLRPTLPEQVTSLSLGLAADGGPAFSSGTDHRTVQVRHHWPAAAGPRLRTTLPTGTLLAAAGLVLLVGGGVLYTVRRRNGSR
ncbi:hypothetical protein CFP65_3706 [Kitasatospora sp. MMS16-BH015]|uniref:hypothetical protein n=1 Tax=Kitasatospora sp. MMS16-BH015 TaxID=2018025 RepID=UPI000CA36B57|nr:hypothetical protein [Kitasatospora sp. MMS16-BH015]AUG78492.1 hypothetical protein CFP65_3706 [Kitasatospora sp. MMS16-BH015]